MLAKVCRLQKVRQGLPRQAGFSMASVRNMSHPVLEIRWVPPTDKTCWKLVSFVQAKPRTPSFQHFKLLYVMLSCIPTFLLQASSWGSSLLDI